LISSSTNRICCAVIGFSFAFVCGAHLLIICAGEVIWAFSELDLTEWYRVFCHIVARRALEKKSSALPQQHRNSDEKYTIGHHYDKHHSDYPGQLAQHW
jgi:hypothetical protein